MTNDTSGKRNGFAASAEEFFIRLQSAILTQAIVAAAQLCIADLLAEEDLSLDALSLRTSVDPKSLSRLMSLLSTQQFFCEASPGVFSLGPLGPYLQTRGGVSLRDYALLWGAPWFWRCIGALPDSLKSGNSAMEVTTQQRLFDYFDADHMAGSQYDAAMHCLNEDDLLQTLVSAFPFKEAKLIVDVGGGTGATIATILKSAPTARGILLDRPRLKHVAVSTLTLSGVSDRCEFLAGDFLQSVPPGADVYLLKWILIDWVDSDLRKLLGSLRNAMRGSSKLLVITGTEDQQPSTLSLQTDVLSIAIPGGVRRSTAEIAELFSTNGFKLHRSTPILRYHLLEFHLDTPNGQ